MSPFLSRLIERSPFRAVSQDDQRSWFFLATIQIGVTICVPLFALGGELGQHARFIDLVPAVIAGALLIAWRRLQLRAQGSSASLRFIGNLARRRCGKPLPRSSAMGNPWFDAYAGYRHAR